MVEKQACVIGITAMLRDTEYITQWLGEQNLSHRQLLEEEVIT
jgi:hypothetical protein